MGFNLAGRTVLIATSLEEVTAITLISEMELKFPGLEFARIKSEPSKLWKIYVNCKHGLYFNEIEVKSYCMKLIKK